MKVLAMVLFFISGLVSANAFAGAHKMAPKSIADNYQVAFINEEVGDKKTWVMVPSNATFKKGQMVTAKIVNVLNAAHGFKIPGSVEPKVIKAYSSETISFKVNKTGTVSVQCHMHPAHVGTKFMVK